MPKTIGERLKEYRKQKDIKVTDFSSLIGVSQGTLSGLENDKSKPSADTLANLVRNTDINIGWLLTGEGEIFLSEKREISQIDDDPEIAELLEGARRVLKSGNPVAFDALERNIRYFDHAVATEKRLEAVEEKLEAVLDKLAKTNEMKKAANE